MLQRGTQLSTLYLAVLVAILVLVGCARESNSETAQAGLPLIPTPTGIPPVSIAALAPPPDALSTEVKSLLQTTDFYTDDIDKFNKWVEGERPHALIIHNELIEEIDSEWLAQQAKQGRVIAAINSAPAELDRALNRVVAADPDDPPVPPVIKEPYLFYRYHAYNTSGSTSGSGFVELTEDPNAFHAFVRRILRSLEASGMELP